jgi:hypothetical protein
MPRPNRPDTALLIADAAFLCARAREARNRAIALCADLRQRLDHLSTVIGRGKYAVKVIKQTLHQQ